MEHDELLAKIKDHGYGCDCLVGVLRAVVERHKPIETYNMNNVHKSWLTCNYCDDEMYPCPTIQAIEKALS